MCPRKIRPPIIELQPLRLWKHWKFAWALASDKVVRANSLDGRPPTFWRHLRWMWRWSRKPWLSRRWAQVAILSQPEKQKAQPAGIVRLSHSKAIGYEVHIALMPWARGQGVGTHLLCQLVASAAECGAMPLVARVREGNGASVRAFEKAGFAPVSFSEHVTRLEYRPWEKEAVH